MLVVIVTHASSAHLATLWRSLLAQLDDLPDTTAEQVRVRIVDSASPDDTVAVAQRLAASARAGGMDADVIALPHNVGYAAAINHARRLRLRGEPMVVSNPDIVFFDGCLPRLLEALDDPSVGVSVPRLVDQRERLLRSRRHHPTLRRMIGEAVFGDHWPTRPAWLTEVRRDDHAADTAHDVDWATGAVLAIGADCDDAVGDWDERFFLYGEEVDHARRVRALGLRVRYVPTATALHLEGGSGRRPELAALALWNRVRDQQWHHGPLAAFAAWWIVMVHTVLRLTRREHREVLPWLLPRRHPISIITSRLAGVSP